MRFSLQVRRGNYWFLGRYKRCCPREIFNPRMYTKVHWKNRQIGARGTISRWHRATDFEVHHHSTATYRTNYWKRHKSGVYRYKSLDDVTRVCVCCAFRGDSSFGTKSQWFFIIAEFNLLSPPAASFSIFNDTHTHTASLLRGYK